MGALIYINIDSLYLKNALFHSDTAVSTPKLKTQYAVVIHLCIHDTLSLFSLHTCIRCDTYMLMYCVRAAIAGFIASF